MASAHIRSGPEPWYTAGGGNMPGELRCRADQPTGMRARHRSRGTIDGHYPIGNEHHRLIVIILHQSSQPRPECCAIGPKGDGECAKLNSFITSIVRNGYVASDPTQGGSESLLDTARPGAGPFSRKPIPAANLNVAD